MAMMEQAQRRNTWRTHRPGTVEHYILELLPRGFDYSPNGGSGRVTKIHDEHRDFGGRFTATGEGSGYLRHSVQVDSMFNTIPAAKFNQAKEDIRKSQHLKVPGRVLVAALEWYQYQEANIIKGRTLEAVCDELGVNRRTLGRYRDDCMGLMEALVFKPEVPAPAADAAKAS